MSKRIIAQDEEIVIGVDVSDAKHNITVCTSRGEILDERVMHTPTRKGWEAFIETLPGCRITVVYEAGPQGYTLYETMRRLGRRAVVIAPVKAVGVKTDRRDARRIARDYLAQRTRQVCVPGEKQRSMRQLLRQRAQIRKDMTRIRNRIKSLIRFHGLDGALTAEFTDPANIEYLQFCVEQQEEMYAFLKGKRDQIDIILNGVAQNPQYSRDMQTLKGIKGIGTLSALELTLNVADMRAFGTGQQFSSYCGLCPGEWSSGVTRRQGHITRSGTGRLRGILVQCAWVAVRHDKRKKEQFEALSYRIGRRKAIVATARRMCVEAWRAINERGNRPRRIMRDANAHKAKNNGIPYARTSGPLDPPYVANWHAL